MQKPTTSLMWVIVGLMFLLGIVNIFTGIEELNWSQDNIDAITGHATVPVPGDVAPPIPGLYANLPAYQTVSFMSWIWIISSVGLWIAGFGLLGLKEWGRVLGLISLGAFLFGWAIIFIQILSETAEAPAAMCTVFLNIFLFIMLNVRATRNLLDNNSSS